MPYNGSGVYNLPAPEYPAVPGTTITAEARNTIDADIQSALRIAATRDGQAVITGNWNWGGFGITNINTIGPTAGTLTASGAWNFTGTATGVTQAPGTNNTTWATTAFVQAAAFAAALPIQAGNADKFVTTNGATASWTDLIKVGTMKFADSADPTKRVQLNLAGVTTATTRNLRVPDRSGYIGGGGRSARTANTILGVGDANAEIVITGAGGFTQTLTAAATLGDGWTTRYWNFSTGNITFDPIGSELIDGALTGVLEPGMGIDIFCDGTKFDCTRTGPTITKILTSGTSGTFPLGVRFPVSEQCGGGGSGGRTSISTDTAYGANSGAYAKKQWNVSPNTAYTYAIGAGAVAPNTVNAAGTAGGNTTLTVNAVTVTANGGSAGHFSTRGHQPSRNTATGGDINLDSGAGNTAAADDTSEQSRGGNTPMGLGEGGFNFPGAGTSLNASGFGAGGSSGSASANAQDGRNGVIIWTY